jgi:hypothetical protein
MTYDTHGEPLITVTLTGAELHAVCNAADHTWYLYHLRGDERFDVRPITEKMRVAWVEQITHPPSSWWDRSFAVHVLQRWTVDLAVDLWRWLRRSS